MAKDLLDNEVQEGDTILCNGLIMVIKQINGGNIIGGKVIDTQRMAGLVIQGDLVCEIHLPFDPTKKLNIHVLKVPANQEQRKLDT